MGNILSWLESRSRWSKLRQLSQSNLVRSSVLMPAFGYMLLLNEQVHSFLAIKYDAGWLLRCLLGLWRLWLLFYGSFFLAIASILFSLRCPSEIKRSFVLIDLRISTLTSAQRFQVRLLRESQRCSYGDRAADQCRN
jgi:hypothetical protein